MARVLKVVSAESDRRAITEIDGKDMAVYVVSNWAGGGNDRVKKLLRLRERFHKLVLVTPGKAAVDDGERLMAKCCVCWV